MNARVTESDIIYTRTGQIGLVFRGRVGVLHNNCFKVQPNNLLDRNYIFWWLQNPSFRNTIEALAHKAAQPDITHAMFKAQPILIPPLAVQDSARRLIDKLFERTQQLEGVFRKELAALGRLKESLLHHCFEGAL